MKRRTVLEWFATAAGTLPFQFLRIWAQTGGFPSQHADTLRNLAMLVLPTELGREGPERIVEKFEHWSETTAPAPKLNMATATLASAPNRHRRPPPSLINWNL